MERKSEREVVVTRTIDGPARLVWEAWTRPELFGRWWVPKSAPISLRSCEMDVRVGGSNRLEFGVEAQTMAFFGRYLEITLEERDGKTLLTMSDLHPSKEALDAAFASGSCDGTPETMDQLEALVAALPS